MAVSQLDLRQIIPRAERGEDSDMYVDTQPMLRIGAP
jgi:hypothetical protein